MILGFRVWVSGFRITPLLLWATGAGVAGGHVDHTGVVGLESAKLFISWPF